MVDYDNDGSIDDDVNDASPSSSSPSSSSIIVSQITTRLPPRALECRGIPAAQSVVRPG